MEVEKAIQVKKIQGEVLHLLEEVQRHGSAYVITQKGKPIARLVPYEASPLQGSILEQKDVLSPIEEDWEVLS